LLGTRLLKGERSLPAHVLFALSLSRPYDTPVVREIALLFDMEKTRWSTTRARSAAAMRGGSHGWRECTQEAFRSLVAAGYVRVSGVGTGVRG
jgi:hypothetical protein